MTAFVLVLALVVLVWAAFLAITVALFVGASVPAPKPPLSKEQVVWLVALSKVANKRRAS